MPQLERERRLPQEPPPESTAKSTTTIVGLRGTSYRATRPIYGIPVDPMLFFAAVLTDCLRERTVGHYLSRAEMFDRIDPFIALQCRRHAWLLADMDDGEISEDVLKALAEVS